MTWSHEYITLACGCSGTGAFDDQWVGAPQRCAKHGDTTVSRMSRVRETAGSRGFQLGVKGVESASEEG